MEYADARAVSEADNAEFEHMEHISEDDGYSIVAQEGVQRQREMDDDEVPMVPSRFDENQLAAAARCNRCGNLTREEELSSGFPLIERGLVCVSCAGAVQMLSCGRGLPLLPGGAPCPRGTAPSVACMEGSC